MLKRLGRTLVLCHHQGVLCNLKSREIPKKEIILTYQRRYEHANSVKIRDSTRKERFLAMYPNAQKYKGAFSSKVQPFSVEAPTLFVHNFINKLGDNLEIPYAYEDGYSAAMCLEKICNNCEKGSDITKLSFRNLSPEEWHEINLAVSEEIPYLDDRTLVSLISVSYRVKGFDKACFDKMYNHFSRILTRRKAKTLTELCEWSKILFQNENSEQDYLKLVERIWTLIEARSGTLAADELLTVYKAIPSKYNHLFQTFYKDFKRNLYSISAHDLYLIGTVVAEKSESTTEFKLMVGWIEKNLDSISAKELQSVLSNFTAVGYFNEQLMIILSHHSIKRHMIDKSIEQEFIQVVLEYCTNTTFYDPKILEIACDMFLNSSADYTHQEMAVLLKAIGVLHYFPPNRICEFFLKIESYIMREALLMEPEMLLDLVTYLLYVDRPVFNLKDFIFSASFQGLVLDLEGRDPAAFYKCLKQIHLFSQACLEIGFKPFPALKVSYKDLYQRLTPWSYIHENVYSALVDFLQLHIPKNTIIHRPRPTFDEAYIELHYDIDGHHVTPVFVNDKSSDRYRKAIFIMPRSAYCKTYDTFASNHMLGSEMVNIKVLEHQNVEVVLIPRQVVLDARYNRQAQRKIVKHLEPDLRKFRNWQQKLRQKTMADNYADLPNETAEVFEDEEKD